MSPMVVRLKRPPLDVFDRITPADQNYVRFRIDPQVVIAIGAQRKASGDDMIGEQVETDGARRQQGRHAAL